MRRIFLGLFLLMSISLFAQPTTSTLIRRAELGDSTAALRALIVSGILYSDTTSLIAMQWELNRKLWITDTTNFRTFSDLKYPSIDGANTFTNNNTFQDTTLFQDRVNIDTYLRVGTADPTAGSNQFFDNWETYTTTLALYKTTNNWHGALNLQTQIDSANYGFAKTAHLLGGYLSTKLRVGSTDTVYNSAAGSSSSIALDFVDGSRFVGNSDTTMGSYPTTYIAGNKSEVNYRRWNRRAINTGLNPDVITAYLATNDYDNVDSIHIVKHVGFTNIMEYMPPHVVVDTAIAFLSKAPANINGTLSNFYHFYGEGDYPSYFDGNVKIGAQPDSVLWDDYHYEQTPTTQSSRLLVIDTTAATSIFKGVIEAIYQPESAVPLYSKAVFKGSMGGKLLTDPNQYQYGYYLDLTYKNTTGDTINMGKIYGYSFLTDLGSTHYLDIDTIIAYRVENTGAWYDSHVGHTISFFASYDFSTGGAGNIQDGRNDSVYSFYSGNKPSGLSDSRMFHYYGGTGGISQFDHPVKIGYRSVTTDSVVINGDSVRTYYNSTGKWTAKYLHNSLDNNILIILLQIGVFVTFIIKRKRWLKNMKRSFLLFVLFICLSGLSYSQVKDSVTVKTIEIVKELASIKDAKGKLIKQLEQINTLENYLMLLQKEGYEFIVADTIKIKK